MDLGLGFILELGDDEHDLRFDNLCVALMKDWPQPRMEAHA